MHSKEKEKFRLQKISEKSLYGKGMEAVSVAYCFRILQRYLQDGAQILEMGPAEGVMTELLLSSKNSSLTVLEGSSYFCDFLRTRFPEICVVNALFEDFEPSLKFDTIVMGHVLEHVLDPVATLSRVRHWLKPSGRIFAAVPNARSVHRQAAVIMGMLVQENALNERDLHHGHRRVFDPELFRAAFTQAGFKIEVFGGYMLKPISNSQIENDWTSSMVESFMQLGERYPDIAAEIYVLASGSDG